MRAQSLMLLYLLLFFTACNSFSKKAGDDKTDSAKAHALMFPEPKWLSTNKVTMAIDSTLSYKAGVKCDSAEIIRYEGAFGEHFFPPLNDEGKWINTIKKRQRLTEQQIQFISAVLGSSATFKHPLIIGCFEPRIGLVYFKNNRVIAQAYLCLGCSRIESTTKLGSNENYASFNQDSRAKLSKFYAGLKIGK